MTHHDMALQVVAANSRLHENQGGQISLLGVMTAAAFACLLLLVINTGAATSGKIELQNASDATAISGATWMARGLNLISLNNVTETQLIAIVLVVQSLDDAIPFALETLGLELTACLASVVAAPICGPILTAQIEPPVGLTVVQQAVKVLRQTLADKGKPLWTAAYLLSKMSGVISVSFPIIGEVEAIRIARQNNADLGVLIPARFLVNGWPSLPVHKGTLAPDLCEPTKQGPLPKYAGYLDLPLLFYVNSFIHVYYRVAQELNYRNLCGGSGAIENSRKTNDLFDCQFHNGKAVWQRAEFDTRLFAVPQPDMLHNAVPENGKATGGNPAQYDCSWTPSDEPDYATAIGGGRYRRVTPKTRDEIDQPVEKYFYHVVEYKFLGANVPEKDYSHPDVAAPEQGDSDPYPYLLGGDKNSSDDRIKKELRYMSIVYRQRPVPASPQFFVTPYGEHRLAYAEAHVYNPTSFDTFTQDWHVALEPVTMLEDRTLLGGLGSPDLMANVQSAAAPTLFGKAATLFGDLARDVIAFFNNH